MMLETDLGLPPKKQRKYIISGNLYKVDPTRQVALTLSMYFNPKTRGLLGSIFFGEMKFALSNFLSDEDLSISYESWDVQLTFDTLINV